MMLFRCFLLIFNTELLRFSKKSCIFALAQSSIYYFSQPCQHVKEYLISPESILAIARMNNSKRKKDYSKRRVPLMGHRSPTNGTRRKYYSILPKGLFNPGEISIQSRRRQYPCTLRNVSGRASHRSKKWRCKLCARTKMTKKRHLITHLSPKASPVIALSFIDLQRRVTLLRFFLKNPLQSS